MTKVAFADNLKPDEVWVDAHCHLVDERFTDPMEVVRGAQDSGVGAFLQGGVSPKDWQRQLALHEKMSCVWPVLGLHPYFVAENSMADCEAALDELAGLLSQAAALGETGLDFRSRVLGSDGEQGRERQISCFEAQLELASAAQKPLVLHIVRAHEEALRVFDFFGSRTEGPTGMVHAFAGNWDQAKDWLDRGFMISVGGAVCRPTHDTLRAAVAKVPIESLLLETDSPDQVPYGLGSAINTPASLLFVAKQVAAIRGMTMPELRDKTRANVLRLLATR